MDKNFAQISKDNLTNLYVRHKLSCPKIAEMFSVNAETVRKKIISFEIPRRKRGSIPKIAIDRNELDELYQQHSMKEIAKIYHCGESLIHKKIHQYGIVLKGVGKGGHRKKTGKVFTEEHKKNLSKSLMGKLVGEKNPNYKGGPVTKICLSCEQEYKVPLARKNLTKFCSFKCRGEWSSKYWVGEKHPGYKKNAVREKVCQNCSKVFKHRRNEPLINFVKKKFCSKECSIIGQERYEGEDHYNYKPDSRRKAYRGKHGTWQRKVLCRDKATCQHCGAKDVALVAHHIKEFSNHKELRWDIDNGITLCELCHWHVHGYKLSDDHDIVVEKIKGRTTRRWNGNCDWCGTFISKRASDLKDNNGKRKKHLFCSKKCSSVFRGRRLIDCLPME